MPNILQLTASISARPRIPVEALHGVIDDEVEEFDGRDVLPLFRTYLPPLHSCEQFNLLGQSRIWKQLGVKEAARFAYRRQVPAI